MAASKATLRMEPYDPDAIDGDSDGIVQEHTAWERPAGTNLLDAAGDAIKKGQTGTVRPEGLKVVDKNNKTVDYKPTYAAPDTKPPKAGTPLADQGSRSLREMNTPNVQQITAPPVSKPVVEKRAPLLGKKPKTHTKVGAKYAEDAGLLEDEVADYQKALDKALLSVADPEERAQMRDLLTSMFIWSRLNQEKEQELGWRKFKKGVTDEDSHHQIMEDIFEAGGVEAANAALFQYATEGRLTPREMQDIADRLGDRFMKKQEKGELTEGQISPEGLKDLKAVQARAAMAFKKRGSIESTEEMADLLDEVESRNPADVVDPEVAEINKKLNPASKANKDFLKDVKDTDGIERSASAEEHVHKNGGDLSDVPDEILLETMLDGSIVDARGNPVDIKDILTDPGLYEAIQDGSGPDIMQNDRFVMQNVKNEDPRWGGIWTVWKFTDKQNGKEYFVKTSQFGTDEALSEKLSDDISGIIGFNRLAPLVHVQGSALDGQKPARWIVMPHVDSLTPDGSERASEFYQVVPLLRKDGGEGMHRDLGQIAVLDYLTNNTDRHSGNMLAYKDENGEWRLMPIDHGLAFGGRSGEATVNPFDPTAPVQVADWVGIVSTYTPEEYAKHMAALGGNGLRGQLDKVNGRNYTLGGTPGPKVDPDVALQAAREAVDRISKADIDDMFSEARLERQGIKLTAAESVHLAVAKELFEARLKTLQDDLDQGGESFLHILHAER